LETDSALLAVELSEVCGTDVYLQQGRLQGVPYPLVPGHVSVGRLSKIRGTLRDVEGQVFREGDRVTFLDVHRTCNALLVLSGGQSDDALSRNEKFTASLTDSMTDSAVAGPNRLYLKPGTLCIKLNGDPETFMAGGCALPTALHAVERGDIAIGDTVLVLGSGPVGIKRNHSVVDARRAQSPLHRRARASSKSSDRSRRRRRARL